MAKLGLLLALLCGLTAPRQAAASFIEAWLAPSADLWPLWQTHNPASADQPDHQLWDAWLQANLVTDAQGLTRIAYNQVTPADRQTLTRYLQYLSALPIHGLHRDHQLAYWINLYNAATIDLVLAHYPVTSIRDIDISPGLFSFGPWDKKILTVAGEDLSLNDIEHRILRPIWQDPRLHYALNCASVGCPSLQPTAFTAANTKALLDQAAQTYVNSPRGVEVIDGKLRLSSIYNWFSEDFGGSYATVTQHLAKYADPGLTRVLAANPRLAGYRYDWALNDAAPPSP